MDKISEAQAIQAQTAKWDYTELRSLRTAKKKNNTKQRGNQQNGRKIFVNHESDKVLISRIYKEFEKLDNNKQTTTTTTTKPWFFLVYRLQTAAESTIFSLLDFPLLVAYREQLEPSFAGSALPTTFTSQPAGHIHFRLA